MMELNQIIQGDCVEVMRTFPDNFFDSIVTDPPYGLEFMGKEWDGNWKYKMQSLSFMPNSNPLPSFNANRNPVCKKCHKLKRGKDKCQCETPDYDTQDKKIEDVQNYQRWCQRWATECLRILKPGGHLLSFGGTRTFHRMVCAIEDAGFEVRDAICWITGQGFPKNLNIQKQAEKILGKPLPPEIENKVEGLGTALKPGFEFICVARKPLSERNVALNVLKWGTGGLNIDGCRIKIDKDDHIMKYPYSEGKYKSEYKGGSSYKFSNMVSANSQGRWPANVILQCLCDEVKEGKSGQPYSYKGKSYQVEGFIRNNKPQAPSNYNDAKGGSIHTNPECPCYMLDEQSGERKGGGSIKNRPLRFMREAREWGKIIYEGYNDIGGASRFFYVAKASREERNMGLGIGTGSNTYNRKCLNCGKWERKQGLSDKYTCHCEKPNWEKPKGNLHPTVKPLRLMEQLVKLVTPPDGVVLDPFVGSGTTCMACKKLGFKYVGIEKEEEYIAIARSRIEAIKEDLSLF